MKTLIGMAREAGFMMENSAAIQAAEIFAELVRADEREVCAKLRPPSGRGEHMSDEAMKLALEALEKMARLTGPLWALENNYAGHLEAINALQEALAERTWQGLTDADWEEISDMPDSFDQGVVWAVRKLKEKNI